MGVLQFFTTIQRHYYTNDAISYINKQYNIDYFLIDFNSLIHTSKEHIISKFKKEFEQTIIKFKLNDDFKLKNLNNKYNYKFNNEIQTETMNIVKKIIDQSIQKLNVLYIAIDGVPSIAKMIEQKKRRFMGKLLSYIELELLEKYKHELINQKTQLGYNNRYLFEKYKPNWSSSNISPGTQFMIEFTKNLNNKDYVVKFFLPKKYIFSDYTKIGEAEKKLINYCIKNIPENKSIMIYSPDADVILLCLLLKHNNIYIIRHHHVTRKLLCVDINKLRLNFYKIYKLFSKTDINLYIYIRDLIFLLTFFGDDFVPPIESYTVQFHLSNVIKAYAISIQKFKNLTISSKSINNKCLINILNELTKNEIENAILIEKYLSSYLLNYRNYRLDYEKWCYKNKIDPTNINFPIILKNCLLLNHNIKKNGIKSVKKNLLFKLLNEIFLKGEFEINMKLQKNNINSKINREKKGKPFNLQPFHIQQIQKNSNFDIMLFGIINMLDIRQFIPNINWESFFNKSSMQLYQLGFTDIPSVHNKFTFNHKKYMNLMINKFNKFNFNNKNPVKSYLDGIMWTFYYYNSTDLGLNNWSYDFIKAPLLTDILKYLNTGYDINKGLETYNKSTIKMPYYTPYEQLIFITPLDDLNILPEKVQQIIKKSNTLITYIKKNNPNLKENAKQIVNYIKPSPINCKDEIFLNKCTLNKTEHISVELQKLAKNIDFSIVNNYNKSDYEN